MRRISSPVAGMKAPCVISGARAEWETAAGYQDNNSLLIVQQARGFSKGGSNRRRRDVRAERRKTLTTKDTKDHKGAQSFFPWCDFACAFVPFVVKVSHARLAELVESPEASVAVFAHVALEHRGIGLTQVDNYKAIDHIRKFAVEIEAHQPASHLGILLDQDRHSFAIFFHIGDGFGEFVEIAQYTAESATIPAAELVRAEGRACLYEVGKLAAVLIFNLALLKVADNHLARQAAVLVADADRAEQHRSLRVGGHETRDPLPQQKQRRVLTLIFGTHKRATQFESGANLQEQLFVVAEHGVGVETLDAMVANDLIGVACAVRTGQFLLLLIPEQQMPVIGVEAIEVRAASGTFAGSAEGDFAEASELIEQVGQLGSARGVDGKFRIFDDPPLGGQGRNIIDDELRWNLGSNRLLRLARKRSSHLRRQRDRLPAAIRKQVSSQ